MGKIFMESNNETLDKKLLDAQIEYVFKITNDELNIEMLGTLYNKKEIEEELYNKVLPQVLCEFLETDHKNIIKFKDDHDSTLDLHIIMLENGKAVLNIRYRDNKIPITRITTMLHAALSYLKTKRREELKSKVELGNNGTSLQANGEIK